jgi:MerR family transcriptional regulator/heat shock protein HspR
MPRGRRARAAGAPEGAGRPDKGRYYMISVVANSYGIHPQTLRLYEREGLLEPSRTEGNTRLYSDEDLRQLEVILNLTRDLGVNLAGVEIILNMRRKMERMQAEMNEFVAWVKDELQRQGREGWQERLEQALVRLPPMQIVPSPAADEPSAGEPARPDPAPRAVEAAPVLAEADVLPPPRKGRPA